MDPRSRADPIQTSPTAERSDLLLTYGGKFRLLAVFPTTRPSFFSPEAPYLLARSPLGVARPIRALPHPSLKKVGFSIPRMKLHRFSFAAAAPTT